MTQEEREEFVYDLANHYASRTTKAGLMAMAIDRMVDLLSVSYTHLTLPTILLV